MGVGLILKARKSLTFTAWIAGTGPGDDGDQ